MNFPYMVFLIGLYAYVAFGIGYGFGYLSYRIKIKIKKYKEFNPHIIIDAWDFNGFDSESFGNEETLTDLIGMNIRVKERGYLEVDTSWGLKKFYEGDRIIIIDIASCIGSTIYEKCMMDPVKTINFIFLHELCHWAEGVHRSGVEHSKKWTPFLLSLLKTAQEQSK